MLGLLALLCFCGDILILGFVVLCSFGCHAFFGDLRFRLSCVCHFLTTSLVGFLLLQGGYCVLLHPTVRYWPIFVGRFANNDGCHSRRGVRETGQCFCFPYGEVLLALVCAVLAIWVQAHGVG